MLGHSLGPDFFFFEDFGASFPLVNQELICPFCRIVHLKQIQQRAPPQQGHDEEWYALSRRTDAVFKPRLLKKDLFPCERITVRQNRFFSGILENRGAGVFLEQSDALLK